MAATTSIDNTVLPRPVMAKAGFTSRDVPAILRIGTAADGTGGPRPAQRPSRPLSHVRYAGRVATDYISSSRRMRSWMGGCVENMPSHQWYPSPCTREGWFNHRCAVALFAY